MQGPVAELANKPDVLRRAVEGIQARLPAGWTLEQDLGRRSFGPDALVTVTDPDGRTTTLVVEAKRSIVTRDIGSVLARLQAYLTETLGDAVPLLVARYIPRTLQDQLAAQDVAYADATGNIRIALTAPALFLRDVGATNDPWRGPGRPKGSMRGAPAAQVGRALVDFTPPYSVPELVTLSGASTGATYRVVEFLEEQALLERPARGPIISVRWREVLTRWSAEYGFLASNRIQRYLALRGLDPVMDGIAATAAEDLRYAVSGSFAALRYQPYAPARLAMIYADEPERLAATLNLRAVDSGANVLIARPAYDVVYQRTDTFDPRQNERSATGVIVTSASQTAVDLMTGPGRNPAEAQALLDWMEANEPTWRRQP